MSDEGAVQAAEERWVDLRIGKHALTAQMISFGYVVLVLYIIAHWRRATPLWRMR